MSALLQPMEVAAIFLLVPLAIIIGHRRPTGAIIVSGSVATVAAIVFWIFLGGFPALNDEVRPSVNPLVVILLFYGGLLLLITAWTLALNSAALARRWGWVFLLVVSGYISFTALIISITTPNPCPSVRLLRTSSSGPGLCRSQPTGVPGSLCESPCRPSRGDALRRAGHLQPAEA